MSIIDLLNKINQYILNPIILLVFAIALLILFWGIFQFINSQTSDKERDAGKKKIIWGVFGMFIMISAYGLIGLVLDTFSIDGPDYIGM